MTPVEIINVETIYIYMTDIKEAIKLLSLSEYAVSKVRRYCRYTNHLKTSRILVCNIPFITIDIAISYICQPLGNDGISRLLGLISIERGFFDIVANLSNVTQHINHVNTTWNNLKQLSKND